MKVIKKYTRIICLFMTMLFFIQSCTIYNFKSSTLDEAVESKKRTKIVTKSGKRLRFKKILLVDNNYYGVKRKDSIMIATDDIRKIKVKNTTASIILSLTGIGVIIFIAVGIANFSPNIGFGDGTINAPN